MDRTEEIKILEDLKFHLETFESIESKSEDVTALSYAIDELKEVK